MALLAPEQRLILSLRVENDLSYTDIAAVLGVREGTVKSRLARARDQLRYDRGQRRARDVHVAYQYEYKVERDIEQR